MPSNYGVKPRSIVYVNDGRGHFTALPEAQAGPLSEAGMITGGLWVNVDAEPDKELVLVGDWMAPRIFKYQQNRFTERKTKLADLYGWWQAVASADLDGDGDEDLILGNLGENFYLRPDSMQPAKLWINGFSRSMLPEKIITRSIKGRDMPVFLKRDLTDQIPTLKKANLRHSEYAGRSIQELFDEELIRTSVVSQVNTTYSCIAWNEGDGKFTVQRLPDPVQYASVNAIHVSDLNGDGRKDLLLGGNLLYWLPQFSRIDASRGHLLLNTGDRQWQYLPSPSSGLQVSGATRQILPFTIRDRPVYLFLRNNERPMMYTLQEP